MRKLRPFHELGRKSADFSDAEKAAAEIAAAEIAAAGFTYEPVYTYEHDGKVYAFSYESVEYGEPAYTAVVVV